MDTYLDQFVDSIKFLEKVDSSFDTKQLDFVAIHNMYKDLDSESTTNYYQSMHSFLRKASSEYAVYFARTNELAHQCHSVCENFKNALNQLPEAEGIDFKVTVGNVFYKGKNIYRLNRKSLKEIVEAGPQLDKVLDVHVWLTLDDMTVYDLTILSTLEAKGLEPKGTFPYPSVLVWRHDIKSDFNYKPLLVDDYFFHRVDRMNYP
ncbi:hypothetical protein V9K20_003506 [Vibrio cholerae]|nr:hypothetical protein [Vibrio cholerae]MBE3853580.1 hypothetical protein [Vibrio parahaemolyticus]ELJ8583388.1 hypothetical protein [Vibrio cholerae]MBM4891806.1 hypothetical protein [Vibrio parahaemolyticus]MDF4995331.1 hypothetical protein [Vibrio parahaemolyticus]